MYINVDRNYGFSYTIIYTCYFICTTVYDCIVFIRDISHCEAQNSYL